MQVLTDHVMVDLGCREEEWLTIKLYCTRAISEDGVHREPGMSDPDDQRFREAMSLATLGGRPENASAFRFKPGYAASISSGALGGITSWVINLLAVTPISRNQLK